MSCARVREALLGQPDEPIDAALLRTVTAHIEGCDECLRLSQALERVNDGLAHHFLPPSLDAGFRTRLRARLSSEERPVWPHWIPTAVHFASCGAATVACVAFLPYGAGVVIGVATAVTLLGHFVLASAQGMLDAAGDAR